jgi:hypothetical protein
VKRIREIENPPQHKDCEETYTELTKTECTLKVKQIKAKLSDGNEKVDIPSIVPLPKENSLTRKDTLKEVSKISDVATSQQKHWNFIYGWCCCYLIVPCDNNATMFTHTMHCSNCL